MIVITPLKSRVSNNNYKVVTLIIWLVQVPVNNQS